MRVNAASLTRGHRVEKSFDAADKQQTLRTDDELLCQIDALRRQRATQNTFFTREVFFSTRAIKLDPLLKAKLDKSILNNITL